MASWTKTIDWVRTGAWRRAVRTIVAGGLVVAGVRAAAIICGALIRPGTRMNQEAEAASLEALA